MNLPQPRPVRGDGERASIIAEMERRYPGYPRVAKLPNLQEENVASVARELLAEDPSSLPIACR